MILPRGHDTARNAETHALSVGFSNWCAEDYFTTRYHY